MDRGGSKECDLRTDPGVDLGERREALRVETFELQGEFGRLFAPSGTHLGSKAGPTSDVQEGGSRFGVDIFKAGADQIDPSEDRIPHREFGGELGGRGVSNPRPHPRVAVATGFDHFDRELQRLFLASDPRLGPGVDANRDLSQQLRLVVLQSGRFVRRRVDRLECGDDVRGGPAHPGVGHAVLDSDLVEQIGE